MISYKDIRRIIRQFFSNSINRMADEPRPEEAPSGKSLQIYWYLLTHGPKGIREIQKALKIPSPSSVSFQINKLVEKGILSKTEEDKYFIKEEIKSGILGFYMRIGYRMIPRFTIYLCIYLVGLLGFLLAALAEGDQFVLNPTFFIFFLYLIFGTVVFIYESLRIWRIKP